MSSYACATCCDTGCVVDPTADESKFQTEADGLVDCPDCWRCTSCGAVGKEAFHTLKCPVARFLRGSWCTPKWLAELIGRVLIDPCSNDRSHINSKYRCYGDLGDDGLAGFPGQFRRGPVTYTAGPTDSAFVNPPYDHGSVIRWVRHWRNTRFIFLLRWDPSTAWFKELISYCTHVWFPRERINFEPPLHIESSSNPFPHALYLRNPDPSLLLRLAPHGYLMQVDKGLFAPQDVSHGEHQRDDRATGAGPSGGGAPVASRAGGGCINRTFHTVPCWEGCSAGRGHPVSPQG